MARTIDITLQVKIRKPTRDEQDEHGYDRDDIREFDLEIVEPSHVVEALNDHFEMADPCEDAIPGCDWPFMISKITASEGQSQK